jgi:hypothetical protein
VSPFELNLADGLFACQVTFDRNVTGIDEKVGALWSGDAARSQKGRNKDVQKRSPFGDNDDGRLYIHLQINHLVRL